MSGIRHVRPCGVGLPPKDKLREDNLPCPGTRTRAGASQRILNIPSSSDSLHKCNISTPWHTPGRHRQSLPLQPCCSGPSPHNHACAASNVPCDTTWSSSALDCNGCTGSARLHYHSPCRSPCRSQFDAHSPSQERPSRWVFAILRAHKVLAKPLHEVGDPFDAMGLMYRLWVAVTSRESVATVRGFLSSAACTSSKIFCLSLNFSVASSACLRITCDSASSFQPLILSPKLLPSMPLQACVGCGSPKLAVGPP